MIKIKVIELAAICLAAFALIFDVGWNLIVERPIQREEAEVRAWQVLSSRASGNSGKTEALSYLATQGADLRGIDISCRTMEGGWNSRTRECDRPTYIGTDSENPLSGFAVSGSDFSGVTFRQVQLTGFHVMESNFEGSSYIGAVIEGSSITGSNFDYCELDGSHLEELAITSSSFSRCQLHWVTLTNGAIVRSDFSFLRSNQATFSNIDLFGSNLASASLSNVTFRNVDFFGVNLSRAVLCKENCVSVLGDSDLRFAWALVNQGPIFAENRTEDVPPTLRSFTNYCNDEPMLKKWVGTAAELGTDDEGNALSRRFINLDGFCIIYHIV